MAKINLDNSSAWKSAEARALEALMRRSVRSWPMNMIGVCVCVCVCVCMYVCAITTVLIIHNDCSHGLLPGSDQTVPLVVVIPPPSIVLWTEGHSRGLTSNT